MLQPVLRLHATPDDWAVVACDVGQGDAVLLRDPAVPDEVMLVDTGDSERALLECLDAFGVHRISLLVLSHDDRDHVGALGAVLARTEAALVAPTSRGQNEEAREPLRGLRAAGVPVEIGAAGLSSVNESGLRWRVLAPAAESTPATTNDASLVLQVHTGSTSVLLLGDTGEDAQRTLLRYEGRIQADVVKVAHHGSRDQHDALTQQLGARWALVSVGADNSYGHPASSTLAGLNEAGGHILRTDRHGSIALVPRPDGALQPWVQHAATREPEPTP